MFVKSQNGKCLINLDTVKEIHKKEICTLDRYACAIEVCFVDGTKDNITYYDSLDNINTYFDDLIHKIKDGVTFYEFPE